MSSTNLDTWQIIQALRSMQHNISVQPEFSGQMEQIKRLLKNDRTGLVSTILDYKIHSGTTSYKIETINPTLNKNLEKWQKSILNKDINIDIPRGLRELSVEYFRERWTSSFVGLRIKWEDVDFGVDGVWNFPTVMWVVDGSAIKTEPNTSLDSRTYTLKTSEGQKPLVNKPNETIIIRKPYAAWYDNYPTPFLVKRGVLFNALLKEAIVNKQADIITQIIPYLFQLKAGSDKLAELQMLGNAKEQMKELKEQLMKSLSEYDTTGEIGKLITTLRYDVNMEHLIPDFVKIFNDESTKAVDKNILAGMGMIEITGFSNTRQEAILNPQVLVQEVKDAVSDWASILEEVMYQLLERNSKNHKILAKSDIRVVPGKIKGFITSDMRSMLRNLYDKGLLSKQTAIEDIGELDFEVEVERRNKETERGLNEKLYPPVTINLEQNENVNPDDVPDDRKPGSPEANNFKSERDEVIAPFNTVDELPESVKNSLPVPAQVIFLRVVNQALENGKSEEDAFKLAWGVVKKTYREPKGNEKKWQKK